MQHQHVKEDRSGQMALDFLNVAGPDGHHPVAYDGTPPAKARRGVPSAVPGDLNLIVIRRVRKDGGNGQSGNRLIQ